MRDNGTPNLSQNPSFFKVYFWCLSYLKPYKKQFILFLFFGLFNAVVLISVPKMIQLFVDKGISSNGISDYYVYFVGFIIILIMMFFTNVKRNELGVIFQEYASKDLQLSIFAKMRKLGFSYFERTPSGDILSLFNSETAAAQKVYRNYFPSIIQSSLMLLIGMSFLMSLNFILSLIFIPSVILYILAGPYFERKSAIYGERVVDSNREVNKHQYDSFSGLLELRAQGREQWDLERLLSKEQQALDVNFIYFIYINLRGAFRRVSVYFGGVLLFVLGFIFVRQEVMTVGEFIAFTLLYFRLMLDLTSLITKTTEQKVLIYQIKRLHQFMLLKPEVNELKAPNSLTKIAGSLQFKDVHFSYNKEIPIIKGFNLDIRPGERVALVGSSGNGKSTLTKLIGRFYDPDEGEIFLDGVNIRQLSFSELREAIGYVFQETYLFAMTIRENIGFGNPDATDDQIIKAAKAAHAHEFIMDLPEGYESLVGERGNKLSGGQKQRIAIARMIVKNPAIVVMDEATSALDSISESHVKQALDNLMKGRTSLVVAHRLSTVKDYDRIIVLDQGIGAEMGTYEELIQKGGLFYQLMKGDEAS